MNLRLSERERDILGRISLSADLSVRALARTSKHHLHTVRRTVERLEQADILKRSWIIDLIRLGFSRFQVLFSISGGARAQVVNFFATAPEVGHFVEISGDFDYDLLVLARDSASVVSLLQRACATCGCRFTSKAVAVQNHVSYFPRKYLCKGAPKYGVISIGDRNGGYVLDFLEERILDQLVTNSRFSKKLLAEKLSVSIPTLDQRLERLRKEGVLRGRTFSPRLIELGVQNFRLLISASELSDRFRKELYQFAYRHSHCTSYRESLGAWDFELNIEVENYQQLTTLKDKLMERFSTGIVSMHTISRFKMHVYTSYPRGKTS